MLKNYYPLVFLEECIGCKWKWDAESKLDFSDDDEFDIEWFYNRVVLLLKVFVF